MFTDLYLRAETEADLKAALPWAVHQEGVEDGPDAGDWITSTPDYALDLIGPVQTKDAVMGEPDPETGEAEVVEPAEWDNRFHANLRLVGGFAPDVPEALIVHPPKPRRVFA